MASTDDLKAIAKKRLTGRTVDNNPPVKRYGTKVPPTPNKARPAPTVKSGDSWSDRDSRNQNFPGKLGTLKSRPSNPIPAKVGVLKTTAGPATSGSSGSTRPISTVTSGQDSKTYGTRETGRTGPAPTKRVK